MLPVLEVRDQFREYGRMGEGRHHHHDNGGAADGFGDIHGDVRKIPADGDIAFGADLFRFAEPGKIRDPFKGLPHDHRIPRRRYLGAARAGAVAAPENRELHHIQGLPNFGSFSPAKVRITLVDSDPGERIIRRWEFCQLTRDKSTDKILTCWGASAFRRARTHAAGGIHAK